MAGAASIPPAPPDAPLYSRAVSGRSRSSRRPERTGPRPWGLLVGLVLVVAAGWWATGASLSLPSFGVAGVSTVLPTPSPEPTPRSAAAAPPLTPTPTLAPTPPPRPTSPPSATPTTAPRPTAAPTVRAASSGAVVALTFDAGSDRGYAVDILDTLRQEHVPASFGITGQWARANADLVRQTAADGHLIINHTLDHTSFTGVSDSLGGLAPARRRAELEQADAVLAPLIGHSTRPWYRLPYGDDDARVAADVAPAGYTRKIGWTIDTLGWRGVSTQDILDRSLRLAAPNAIYLLHVGRASQDGPALPRLIRALRERGYGFVSVADLPG